LRAVLDPNVLVAAILSRAGPPARLIERWLEGDYELVVSPLLLGELSRAFAYPKLRKRVGASDATHYVNLLRKRAVLRPDPEDPTKRSIDPDDDYLLALAEQEQSVLVSGDQHLLGLADSFPVLAPQQFLRTLETEG
jgi:putative PIN family toxin of toxin-antitoxin system